MTNLKRIRAVVEGRVQGVYYRASTQTKATELALTGWVRNLPNGGVEFEAQGDTEQLQQLLAWAGQGPEMARVTHLQQQQIPALDQETEFVIRY